MPKRTTLANLQTTVDSIEDKLNRIYAVAAAGQAFIGEEAGTAASLFVVIQDMASGMAELRLAQNLVATLCAGEVPHG